MHLVTVRDLLENKFSFTCSTDVLELFERAVRQRQLALRKFNVPEILVTALEAQLATCSSNSKKQHRTEQQESDDSSKDYDTLAYCMYHFISFKYWESANSSKLFAVDKADFEDSTEKGVAFYRSKLPVCFDALHIRAHLGYSVVHTAVAVISAPALQEIVAMRQQQSTSTTSAKKKSGHSKKLIHLSNRKFSTSDTAIGEWSVVVEVQKVPHAAAAEFRISIKPRSDVAAMVCTSITKFSKLRCSSSDDDDEKSADDDSSSSSGNDYVTDAFRFSELHLVQGRFDPAPLPRDPRKYALPQPVEKGPTLQVGNGGCPLGHELGPVETTCDPQRLSTLRLTPLSASTNQTISSVQFRQLVFFTIQAVNLDPALVTSISMSPSVAYDKSPAEGGSRVVAQKTQLAICTSGRGGETYVPGNIDIPPRESLVICVRAEFTVDGSCGSGNFERSLLDRSFPDPCQFAITLREEHSGAAHALSVLFRNSPLDLPTKESFACSWDIPKEHGFLAFAQADDVDKRHRYAAGVYVSKDGNELIVRRENMYITIGLMSLHRVAYDAARSGLEEVPMENFETDNHKASWLVSHDVFPCVVYGIKVGVVTSTSSASASCHVQFRRPESEWIARPVTAAESGSGKTSQATSPLASTASKRDKSESRGGEKPVASVTSSFETSAAAVRHSDPVLEATPSSSSASFTRQVSVRSSQGPAPSFTIHYDEPLGAGAFGQVFKAFDHASGMTVAVKETTVCGLLGPNKGQQSIQSEFDVLTSLSHPSIVKVFALDCGPSILRVFMEWMPSGCVRVLLDKTRFRLHEGVIKRYMTSALRGLAYLHAQSILHLDLKPANMLVSADGRLKLADFGTTKWLAAGSNSVTTQQIIGTPAYMAPEIITTGKYSKASDMWAIGCCIVEMCTGEMPWAHVDARIRYSATPLMFHIASSKPPAHCPVVPKHLSEQLRSILSRCFSPNLAVRPSAEELLQDPYFTDESLPVDAEDVSSFADAAAHAQEAAKVAEQEDIGSEALRHDMSSCSAMSTS